MVLSHVIQCNVPEGKKIKIISAENVIAQKRQIKIALERWVEF